MNIGQFYEFRKAAFERLQDGDKERKVPMRELLKEIAKLIEARAKGTE